MIGREYDTHLGRQHFACYVFTDKHEWPNLISSRTAEKMLWGGWGSVVSVAIMLR